MAFPTPKRPCGYKIGSGDALVQVEAFVDIECPFSKKAWPTLLDVANHYSETEVSLTVYPYILCDHRQSWDITKAAVLLAQGDPMRFWQFFGYLYMRQDEYANQAFDKKARVDLYDLLAAYAADFADQTDKSAFLQQLNSDAVENQAKMPIRYGITRGVWSTPTFFINGAESTDLSSSSTIADWQQRLDNLLSA
jgi:protein-disulfide isomerase